MLLSRPYLGSPAQREQTRDVHLTPSRLRRTSERAVGLHTLMHSLSFEYAPLRRLMPHRFLGQRVRPGERIYSLQTCTLPDFAQRLVVRAWLTDVRCT